MPIRRRKDQDRSFAFTRRTLLLGAAQVGLFGVLGGRMYQLQVVDQARYNGLAEDNRVSLRLIAPQRGVITDREGLPLALNQPTYRAYVVPEQNRALTRLLDDLNEIVPVSERDRQRVMRQARRLRSFMPITVLDDLSWEQVAQISLNLPDLAGLHTDHSHKRIYPQGPLYAHIIGYTGAVTEEDLNGDPVLTLPEFRLGKSGIERTQDLALRGRAGRTEIEVNAVGRTRRELSRIEPKAGDTVTLTIDTGLQRYAADRLGNKPGSVVVIDVETGDLLAMVSTPSFDPNLFSRGIAHDEWKALVEDETTPLVNKSTAGMYAPGSTFKMITALAALEGGAITRNQAIACRGVLEFGEGKFHCWKRGGHGAINMHEAIAQSCDVYFYEAARRIGIDKIAQMAHRLGVGTPLGLDLPGERHGLVPTRNWKRQRFGKSWQIGETLIAGIGQGYVLATPLQLAVMTARLVNGGRAVTPRLVRSEVPQAPDIGLPRDMLLAMRAAMAAVVDSPTGTAKAAQIPIREFAMGGKTGTSQVRRISASERRTGVRRNEDLPWRERDHALFVGYAPLDRPRYACAVILEHGGGGSKDAAPVARDVLLEAQRRDPLGRPSPVVQRDAREAERG